ncbi:immunity 49 family protein [Streptomyces sp. NBC_01294]|nr:Imm49 family immunity protein [Streptomyces sp. NBC_01294]WRZ61862.1 immunity 49 family protein [Streptomyces sp. NBC_01294]
MRCPHRRSRCKRRGDCWRPYWLRQSISSTCSSQDTDGFNEALVQALELHKAYWTVDEQRAEKPVGHLALAPLALACFAFDGKMPVQVESGYMPHHLLTRGWLGEFPT